MSDPDYETRLRDQAALAALGSVIIQCAGDGERQYFATSEQYFSKKAFLNADAFMAERAQRYTPVGNTDDSEVVS